MIRGGGRLEGGGVEGEEKNKTDEKNEELSYICFWTAARPRRSFFFFF